MRGVAWPVDPVRFRNNNIRLRPCHASGQGTEAKGGFATVFDVRVGEHSPSVTLLQIPLNSHACTGVNGRRLAVDRFR